MQPAIDITDDDILFAESILLSAGEAFCEQRRAFIRNLNTIDLQAVPGSGKTTVLLAKLLILERKLPFAGGGGILVISHTNAAIDEIKQKIQKHCPKLFSYPNYIGTIQGFVDEFLAVPFYIAKYHKAPIRIDNEFYEENVRRCLEKLWLHKFESDKDTFSKVAYIKNNNEQLFYDFRFRYYKKIELEKKFNGDSLVIQKPRGNTRPQNYKDYTVSEKQSVYNWFFAFKKFLISSGVLHFEDAYFLAEMYLVMYPQIRSILQNRFSYIFIDEMQDMDMHQYTLLEKIFYDEGNSISVFQRLGDRNQAIYNTVKAEEIWVARATVLPINGSQRLSKPIADVVKKFALHFDEEFDIIGLNDCCIKPHIIVFDNHSIKDVIPTFSSLVKQFRQNGTLKHLERPVKVICWNTEWKDDVDKEDRTKLRLVDYHQTFKKEKSKPRQDYRCLKSYLLFYDKNKMTLESARKSLLSAFLKILRLESIYTSENKPYTKKKMIDFIRESNYQKYEELKLHLFHWSMGLIKGEISNILSSIKSYLHDFICIFTTTPISKSITFIDSDTTGIDINDVEKTENTNRYKEDGLNIDIESVHAVKGQTHCATLYLESYFYKDGSGDKAKSYESQRLAEQFLGNPLKSNIGERVKQSAKMVYVGFSRPTDFLCVAIHRDRFDSALVGLRQQDWEIIKL